MVGDGSGVGVGAYSYRHVVEVEVAGLYSPGCDLPGCNSAVEGCSH